MHAFKKLVVLALVSVMLLSGCASPVEVAPATSTSEPLPTATQRPSDTPLPPTLTPIPPTATPIPTATPTPLPTHTPTVTPTFSPATLSFLPGEPLRIGYILWVSNPMGIDSLRGVEIAVSDFGGELLGHPIELTGYDDECNNLAAQRAAQSLVQDDSVIGIIGTSCSNGAVRAAPIVSDASRVLISPTNTDSVLTGPGSRSAGYFRTAPNDRDQSVAVAQYAYDSLAARRLAVIYTAGAAYQQNRTDSLCAEFSLLGGECVLQLPNPAGNTYMDPLVNSLISAGADAVYFMNWEIEPASAFAAAMRTTPDVMQVPVLLWEIFLSPAFLTAAGENAVGTYVSRTTFEFEPYAAYTAFLETYRGRYGEEPLTEYHAYAYDAALLLLNAIAQVAVQAEDGALYVDPLAVREALYRLAGFQGLTGSLTCSSTGDCAIGDRGRLYQFTSADPATFNPGPADQLSSNPSQVWP